MRHSYDNKYSQFSLEKLKKLLIRPESNNPTQLSTKENKQINSYLPVNQLSPNDPQLVDVLYSIK